MWKNKERDHDRITVLIHYLLDNYVHGRGIIAHPYANVISKEIQSMSISLREYDVLSILNIMKRNNEKSLEYFERIYKTMSSERKIREWILYVPMYFNLPKKKIQINGYNIHIIGRNSQVLKEPFMLFPHGKNVELNEFLNNYLVIKTRDINISYAWKTVEPTYKVIAGVIDYVQNKKGFHYIGNEQRSNWKNPEYILGTSKYENSYLSVDKHGNKGRTIRGVDTEQKKEFNKLIKILSAKSKKGSTAEMISTIFRLYHEAMTSKYEETVFMRLWQIAEILTLSVSLGGNTTRVINRIKWHLKKGIIPGDNIDATLNLLKEKRNILVHQGINQIDSDDINVLKMLCDDGIEWIIDNRKKLSNRSQLETYYEFRTASPNRIKNTAKVVNILLKNK